MKLNITTLTLVMLIVANLTGQTSKNELDRNAIKAMVGCFDVEFKYTETFAPEVDYEKAYDYTSAAFEYGQVVEETDDKIVIQHLLIINDSMIIKHWRQDWTYEKGEVYRYDKDHRWVYEPLDSNQVTGKWTQEVYQVDDGPRYTGTATWTHVDGVSSWFHKADSPLPRREYTKRDDYNVMKRGNRVQVMPYGWLHEQDNDKIIREDQEEDVLLAQEKGYNTYRKRPEGDCKVAQEWWQDNHEEWASVRAAWSEIYNAGKSIQLLDKVNDKRLYEHLFFGEGIGNEDELKELLNQYVLSDEGM